jgi:protocatechuate 3,4-dioxygenase beta subunit
MDRHRISVSVLLAGALSLPAAAGAQEQRAAIEGTVRDAQGGLVAGAAVVVASPAGVSLEAVTDARGGYRFAALAPGRYVATARLAGFQPVRVEGIELRLG